MGAGVELCRPPPHRRHCRRHRRHTAATACLCFHVELLWGPPAVLVMHPSISSWLPLTPRVILSLSLSPSTLHR